jgi:hypothetical protein
MTKEKLLQPEQIALQKAIKIYGLRPLARKLEIPFPTLYSAAYRVKESRKPCNSKIFTDPFIAILVEKLTNGDVKAKTLCHNSYILNNHLEEIREIVEKKMNKR